MDPILLKKLLSLAKNSEEHGVGNLSSLTVRSIVSSINRGFLHMIETLKAEFCDLLYKSQLFDSLVSYFVHVSG